MPITRYYNVYYVWLCWSTYIAYTHAVNYVFPFSLGWALECACVNCLMMVTSADQTNESPGNVAHHRMDVSGITCLLLKLQIIPFASVDCVKLLNSWWWFHTRMHRMICKNKTSFRPNLDPKGTLSSILTVKLASTEQAHSYEPPQEVLRKAKSATWEYNKAHLMKPQ